MTVELEQRDIEIILDCLDCVRDLDLEAGENVSDIERISAKLIEATKTYNDLSLVIANP